MAPGAPSELDRIVQDSLERGLAKLGAMMWRHRRRLTIFAAVLLLVFLAPTWLSGVALGIVGAVGIATRLTIVRDAEAEASAGGTGTGGSLWDPILLGHTETDDPVNMSLVERNLLIGGIPGSGKSAAMSLVLAAAAADRSVKIIAIDAKQVELSLWEGCYETLAVRPEEANRQLEQVQAMIDRRFSELRHAGLRKVTQKWPLWLVAIDELAYFTVGVDKRERDEFNSRLRDLVSRGRAAGVIVVAATQKPSADVVPTYIRDLFAYRWALACTTPEASDTILGSGYASRGADASTIPPDTPGTGYLLAEGGAPIRFRSRYLDDEAVGELAGRARHARGRL